MKSQILVATLLSSFSLHAGVLTPPVLNPANGHFYTLLTSNTWTGAQAEAVAMAGNLTTIDDAAENDWVFDTFSGGQRNLWIGLNDGDFNGTYTWAEGTGLSYSNWDTGPSTQPDLGNEHWVFIAQGDLGHSLSARKWHDVLDDPAPIFPWIGPVFGVVEQATQPFCSPHRAKATATIVNGTVAGATITDFGCGYTNAPLVLIKGDGSGATATAILSNGVVAGINLTSAGCCYSTNPPPRFVIASPPFVPTVSIAVSRVNVMQHVVMGRKYLLEASSDLVTWTPTGPEFIAEDEEKISEFVVNLVGQFYRIREVP